MLIINRVNSWRITWPFARFSVGEEIKQLKGRTIILFDILPEWSDSVNPGDAVEVVDRDDLHPWIKGTIVFAKKTAFGNLSKSDIGKSLLKALGIASSKEEISGVLSEYYNTRIPDDRSISVICIRTSDIDYPTYYFEE